MTRAIAAVLATATVMGNQTWTWTTLDGMMPS